MPLLAAMAFPAGAFARSTPPPVPACAGAAGICLGVPLKSEIGPAKVTAAHDGVVKLGGPGPLQTTMSVACGDLGCIFNHLDWHVGLGGTVKKGCEVNTTKCNVAIAPNGAEWVPVVVTQNDFPKAFFLLWRAAGSHIVSGTITKAGKPLGGVSVSARGPHGGGGGVSGLDGRYEVGVEEGRYTLAPAGAKFTPKDRSVTVSGNVGGQDFNAKSDGPVISGHVFLTCDSHCSAKRKGAKGVTVVATGGDGPRKGVTDTDGAYSIDDLKPDTSYDVMPKLADGADADPPSQTVALKDASVGGVDFGVCAGVGASSRATGARDEEPCERTYYLRVEAWLPYGSIADPTIGAQTPAGTDYPISPYDYGTALHLSDPAYPPCIPKNKLEAFNDNRPDLMFRARFAGDRHIGYGEPGLGVVTIPIIFNRSTGEIRTNKQVSVHAGSLDRIYDYTVNGKPQPSCTVKRPVLPQVGVYERGGKGHFEINVSYPIPYKPFEDADDLKDFGELAKPLTGAAKKQLDDALKKIPGYSDLPKALKGRVDTYALKLGDAVGLGPAIKAVQAILKGSAKAGDLLSSLTPPPIKLGKKALEILGKAAYGSADMRIEGNFIEQSQEDVVLNTVTNSDGFPSFGFSLTRSGPGGSSETVPWRGSQNAPVQNTFTDGLPDYVTNSALISTGMEQLLQGEVGGKLLVQQQLAILTNATPQALSFALSPNVVGTSRPVPISWRFFKGVKAGR